MNDQIVKKKNHEGVHIDEEKTAENRVGMQDEVLIDGQAKLKDVEIVKKDEMQSRHLLAEVETREAMGESPRLRVLVLKNHLREVGEMTKTASKIALRSRLREAEEMTKIARKIVILFHLQKKHLKVEVRVLADGVDLTVIRHYRIYQLVTGI